MTICNANDAVGRVSDVSGVPPGRLRAVELARIDAYRVYEPVRGGLRVIVGSDGSVMAAGSTLTTDQATELYEAGRRTELEDFDDLRQRNQTSLESGPMSDEDTRYRESPMLRFLDGYVLDSIGMLDQPVDEFFTANLHNLTSALGVQGNSWQEAVEEAMDIPPEGRDALRNLWQQAVILDQENGFIPDPLTFAREFVDFRFGSGRTGQ